ncbi:oligosaccharide flippase family protein [Flavobacterium sp.]|uniref:oligosaccharide flippase family protein n=1 Tax=Flavobacterium sp. TaxID=239 RepID=UPI0035B208D6
MLKGEITSKLKSQKIKNFIIYGLGQGVNILSPLLITPYLIFVCGLEKLGVIAMGQSLAYILIVIVDYSSYVIGVKEISINRNDKTKLEELFKTIYFAKLFLVFLVLLIVLLLVWFIPFFSNNISAILFSFFIILGQFVNPTWFLQGVENFKWITIINILSKVIYVVGVFIFIKSESDFVYANFWLGFGAIISSLIGLIYIVRMYKFKFNQISIIQVKELLINDFSFCVSQLFFAVRNYSTVLIIGFFSGEYTAGQFKVIEQITSLFRTYLQMFFKFSYSYVCFEVDKSINKGLLLWKKFNGLNFILVLGLLLLTFLFSHNVLVFFKVDNSIIKQLEFYLHIALLIPFFTAITLPLEQLIFSLNKNKIYIILTIATTIFNIAGISFLMIFFGLLQVFFLLIITEIFLITMYFSILKKYFTKTKSIS